MKSKIATLIALIALWQLISMILDIPIVPPPTLVFAAMFTKYYAALVHMAASILRVFAAVAISAAGGISCALAASFNNRAGGIIYSVIEVLHPVPKIALLPVLFFGFGLGEASKIALLVLICFFPFAVHADQAVKATSKSVDMVFCSLGATRVQRTMLMLIPSAAGGLLSALRICFATALSVLFFAETYGTQIGIGAFISDAWMRVSYVEMYCGIVTLAICGLVMLNIIDYYAQKFKLGTQ